MFKNSCELNNNHLLRISKRALPNIHQMLHVTHPQPSAASEIGDCVRLLNPNSEFGSLKNKSDMKGEHVPLRLMIGKHSHRNKCENNERRNPKTSLRKNGNKKESMKLLFVTLFVLASFSLFFPSHAIDSVVLTTENDNHEGATVLTVIIIIIVKI